VPLARLREGSVYEGRRVSFGSFQRGIHRGRDQRGPAALTLTTSFNDPYADTFDEAGALFTYAYRAGSIDQPDNRALRAAFELQTSSRTAATRRAGQFHCGRPDIPKRSG
jgi:hypothetical protein